MNDSIEQIFAAIAVVTAIVTPLMVAALAGVFVAATLYRMLGLADPTVAAVARAIAVVLVIVWLGRSWAEQVRVFTAASWSTLAALGQRAP